MVYPHLTTCRFPPYRFVNDATIRIGENPPGSNFEFSSIRQI